MKRYMILSFALVLGTSIVGFAQKESEFTIELSPSALEVKPGETREVTINLVRSRAYNKSKAKLGISSTLPKGVSVAYEPQDGMIHTSTARITVTPETPAGTYTIVTNCTMNNKSKGALLKLVVADATSSSKND